MATSDPVVACVGDSALWCTGTRFEDKTPNVVHKILTGSGNRQPDGDPIPPAQYRARGGAIIGVDHPYRITRIPNWQSQLSSKKSDCQSTIASQGYSADDCKVAIGKKSQPYRRAKIQLNPDAEYLTEGDVYGFIKHDADPWYDYYSRSDKSDINQLKWSIARDIGWHWPRIVDQLEQFPPRGNQKPDLDVPRDGTKPVKQFDGPVDTEPPYAEDVDVLLLNGGTNDIALGWLNNPGSVLRPGIRAATKKHCYHDIKALLGRARSHFPNAIILLVGYFPYASDWTWRKKAKQFLEAKVGAIGNLGVSVELATDNALNFARIHSYWMRRAVSEFARTDHGPGTVYVARGFGVVNAFDAPEAWAWGTPADETDDTGQQRAAACDAKHDGQNAACDQASIGHPNREGSRQTAQVVVDRYEGYTNLGVRDPAARQTDGRPVSVRDACENYDLDPGGDGLRYCLSHREVDSFRVEIRTGSSFGAFSGGGGSGRLDPQNDVYLQIEPGRTGNGERFRLESEKNDFKNDSTDVFFIDPMMGRQITADVGPIPESHGMDSGTWDYQQHISDGDDSHGPSHLTETDHPNLPYTRAKTADSLRLELGMIERLSLDIVDTDKWDLDYVNVQINGFIEYSQDLSNRTVKGDVEIELMNR